MYQKFTDKDLFEVYNLTKASGKVGDDLLKEIENRGGIESLSKKLEISNIKQKEINRIRSEVKKLTSAETNAEFIKNFISSDILSEKELSSLIEFSFNQNQKDLIDSTVTLRTIIGGIVGIVIGILITGTLLLLLTIYTNKFYYYFLVPAYLINYLFIKLITKQSAKNAVVFIFSLIATVLSAALVFIILYYLPMTSPQKISPF